MGMQIDSLELIGYDPEMDTFPSTVYSNLSPAPLPYKWDVKGRHGDDRRGVRPWTRPRVPGARTARSRAAGVPTRCG
jgi:hypothetical protein